MSSRADEHKAWNEFADLKEGSTIALFCPRCATPHVETKTHDPSEDDFMHHVHQCHACGLRFDVFVRCRGIVRPGGYA